MYLYYYIFSDMDKQSSIKELWDLKIRVILKEPSEPPKSMPKIEPAKAEAKTIPALKTSETVTAKSMPAKVQEPMYTKAAPKVIKVRIGQDTSGNSSSTGTTLICCIFDFVFSERFETKNKDLSIKMSG